MSSFRLPPLAATTPWSAGINLAGALAVAYGLWRGAPHFAPWVVVAVAAGLVAWVARTLLATRWGARAGEASAPPSAVASRTSPDGRVLGAALLAVMVIAGALTAIPTQGLGVALLVVAVLVVTSDPASSPLVWGAVVLAGALGIAVGTVLALAGLGGSGEVNVLGLLAVIAGLVLSVVAGFGRRAQRVLLAERERASAEALRAQAAAHRIAIARDLHDVLAHSLGGLVVQLDAVEALLDAGDTERAAARVAAARGLAVEGLGEAREAVRALREPEPERGSGSADPVAAAAVETRIRALIAAEQGVRLDVAGVAHPMSGALAEALVRTVQEGLSNARKHAPGAAVRVGLVWHPDRVECTIENPVSAAPTQDGALAATGGGYGLRGVRERFAVLGGTVQAGVVPGAATAVGSAPENDADRFVLRAEAPA
ncbi:MAG: histidine kinase [Microbacterium sp.]|uniref:sensor histidine kinase n=1 Tax=Microbacterium sp. TaxID=51671 RepID=UPI002831F29B|nr:histidine kinase [Microbacterium sp.]MDR2321368.1 histidine kinase [Microbacterium sp.]